jgi:two-component system LytT family response regulator
MNPLLKVLIVDDEPEARQRLHALLDAHPELEVIAESGTVADARIRLQSEQPDVVFLDMEMPGGSGLELVGSTDRATHTVFVTAYPDYVFKAFEFGAFDYLLKPVDPDRLAITVERLLDGFVDVGAPETPVFNSTRISGQIHRIPINDILWIESFQNYSFVHTIGIDKPRLSRHTLMNWEALLSLYDFVRLGRSEIIHTRHIATIQWSSRDESLVRFMGSDKVLKLGRAASIRLKAHIKKSGSEG